MAAVPIHLAHVAAGLAVGEAVRLLADGRPARSIRMDVQSLQLKVKK